MIDRYLELQFDETAENFDVVFINNNTEVGIDFGEIQRVDVHPPYYEGSYTVTPSSEEQTIPVSGFVMSQDLTVAPIPSNYGLVAYNGSIITVS